MFLRVQNAMLLLAIRPQEGRVNHNIFKLLKVKRLLEINQLSSIKKSTKIRSQKGDSGCMLAKILFSLKKVYLLSFTVASFLLGSSPIPSSSLPSFLAVFFLRFCEERIRSTPLLLPKEPTSPSCSPTCSKKGRNNPLLPFEHKGCVYQKEGGGFLSIWRTLPPLGAAQGKARRVLQTGRLKDFEELRGKRSSRLGLPPAFKIKSESLLY